METAEILASTREQLNKEDKPQRVNVLQFLHVSHYPLSSIHLTEVSVDLNTPPEKIRKRAEYLGAQVLKTLCFDYTLTNGRAYVYHQAYEAEEANPVNPGDLTFLIEGLNRILKPRQ